MTLFPKSPARLGALLAPVLAAVLMVAAPAPAIAQTAQVTIAANSYGATRQVEVELNKSMLIDLPAGVGEVIVSQPSIAGAIMRSRTRAILQGMAEGATNIIFLDDAGRTIQVLNVNVVQPPFEVGRALEETLARVIPGSNIRVETLSNNSINDKIYFVLTGTVLSSADKLAAESMASALSESDSSGSLIQVVGPQQVMLQVTVSEVKRDVARQFGINLGAAFSVGTANFGFNSAPMDNSFPSSGVNANFSLGPVDVAASMRALEGRGALRILAQPTLTAISGQEATFLAGGEIPYGTTDANGNTTVVFRPYGVELSFTPVVHSNGTISLTVNTSVSEPQANFALSKRSASTSVELTNGTTLAIGGLLQETSRQQINQFPGLGDIPILGALFRSRDFQTEQTELVILVTPCLVNPQPAGTVPVPTDFTTVASDAEGIFLGRLENMYGVSATGEFRGSFSGSVGFILD
jgi:pilus assembly protein CpaC